MNLGSLGYGIDFIRKAEPFYHGMTADRNTWELVYPVRFFVELVKSALTNLESYLGKEGLDPYTSYKFGSRWREDED